jgi:hypothetical protein
MLEMQFLTRDNKMEEYEICGKSMKKIFFIVVILGFAFGIAAVLEMLPEPIQTKVEDAFNAWIPAKDRIAEKAAERSDHIWDSTK